MSRVALMLAVSFVVACGRAPEGPPLTVAVAPLALDEVGVACYDLTVSGAGGPIWSHGVPGLSRADGDGDALCSDRFGSPDGDIAYVGTCDASPDADVDRFEDGVQNAVRLWIDGLYRDGGEALDDWQDPCPGGCALEVTCSENADARVDFRLTFLRDASQGFFDIAVDFDDLFCSAKVDSCDASESFQRLVFGADGVRDRTAVVGFACTAGTDATATRLMYGRIAVECEGGTFVIDPTAGPGEVSVEDDAGDTLHLGVYRGVEALTCDGDSCRKLFWNLALSLDDLAALGGDCRLSFDATADDEGSTAAFVAGLPSATSAGYPYVSVGVDLTAGGDPLCFREGLGDGAVAVVYRGDLGGLEPPVPMCHAFDGAVTSTGAEGCDGDPDAIGANPLPGTPAVLPNDFDDKVVLAIRPLAMTSFAIESIESSDEDLFPAEYVDYDCDADAHTCTLQFLTWDWGGMPEGDVTFTIWIVDGNDGREPLAYELTVTFGFIEVPPTAGPDQAFGIADDPFRIAHDAYAANDSDPNNSQSVSFAADPVVVDAPDGASASVDIVAAGLQFYGSLPGTYTVRYTITDGLEEASADITITLAPASDLYVARFPDLSASYQMEGLAPLADGGAVATRNDGAVTRVDADGHVVFQTRAIDEVRAPFIVDLMPLGAGYIGVGYRRGPTGNAKYATVRGLDASGVVQWAHWIGQATTQDQREERWSAVAPIGAGDFVVAGLTESYLTDRRGEGFVARLDGDGNYLWAKAIGTLDYDEIFEDVAVLASGDIVAVGRVQGSNLDDALITRLGPDGSHLNTSLFLPLGIEHQESLGNVIATADGGFLVGGIDTSGPSETRVPFVVKYDADAIPQWSVWLSFHVNTRLKLGLAQGNDGGFFVHGGDFPNVSHLAKLDASGAVVWGRRIEEYGGNGAASVRQLADGRLLVVTDSASILRLAPDGTCGPSCTWITSEAITATPRTHDQAGWSANATPIALTPTAMTLTTQSYDPVTVWACGATWP